MTKHITVNRFVGVNPSIPARQLPDDVLADSLNVYFKDDLTISRYGYTQAGQQLNGKIVGFGTLRHLIDDSNQILAFTPSDIYKWNEGTALWDYATPVHISGTIAATGSLTLSGVACGFDTTWDMSTHPYEIRFGTTNPNAATSGSVTGWYSVGSFTSTNKLTITTSGVVTSGQVSYCIRRTLQGTIDDYVSTVSTINADMERVLLITNGVDPVMSFNGSTVSYVTAAPVCRYLGTYFNYALAAYVEDGGISYPQSVWNSEIANPYDWSIGDSGTSYARNFVDQDDWITGMIPIRHAIAVYKERSICLIELSGSDVDPFNPTENHVKGVGTFSGRTVVDIGGDRHLFMGAEDVYAYNLSDPQPVGGAFKSAIFDNLNQAYLSRCHAVHIESLDSYLLFVPSLSSEECDKAFILNYKTGQWSPWTFAHNITASTVAPLDVNTETGYRWCDVADQVTWADMTETMGLRDTSTADVVIFGDEDGNVYRFHPDYTTDNGVNIEANLTTKQYLYWIYPSITFARCDLVTGQALTGAQIRVSASVDGETWLSPYTLDIASADDLLQTLMSWEAVGRTIQIKIENRQGSAFVVRSIDIEYTPAGRVINP